METQEIKINDCIITINDAAIFDTSKSDDVDRFDKSRVIAYAGADQHSRPWIIFCNECKTIENLVARQATHKYLSDDSSLNLEEFCAFGQAYSELIGWCSTIEIDPMNIGGDADMDLTCRMAEILTDAGFPTVAKHATNDRSCNDIPVEIWLAAIAWASYVC